VDYLVWQAQWQDDWCRLGLLQNVEGPAQLRYGLSRAAGFPDSASFRMDADFPNDTLLTDCLKNSSGELVVSESVVAYLRKAKVDHVEFLPVTVLDHRGRPVDERYTIVHPISPVECLNLEASQPQWNRIIPGQIRRVEKFVIDPARVDPQRILFRCAAYTEPKIVHRSLADGMKEAGFVGCEFVDLEAFRG
jgi:hypothetical protein